MNLNFNMPVKLISGRSCIAENAGVFSRFGTKCLIVTGKSSAIKSGAIDDIKSALEQNDIKYEIFDEICENPYLQHCHECGTAAREFGADFIIGVGGGSPLDASKAAAIYAANPQMQAQEIYDMDWANPPLDLILAGTTAGTGSEVTAVSVLTDKTTGRKRAITHPDCYAKISFLDPKYTDTMPISVTISTALDALSHAVEGFLSPSCGEFADIFARKSIPIIWNALLCLEKSEFQLDENLRDELYYASIWAGFVLNSCGTAFPHPFGYILTEDFAIAHGRACAAFLPELVEYNLEKNPERAVELLELIDAPYTNFISVISGLADCGGISMTEEQILNYADRWENLKNFKNVYGGYSPEQGIALFKKLFLIKN